LELLVSRRMRRRSPLIEFDLVAHMAELEERLSP
jgi:hypothetical protein